MAEALAEQAKSKNKLIESRLREQREFDEERLGDQRKIDEQIQSHMDAVNVRDEESYERERGMSLLAEIASIRERIKAETTESDRDEDLIMLLHEHFRKAKQKYRDHVRSN